MHQLVSNVNHSSGVMFWQLDVEVYKSSFCPFRQVYYFSHARTEVVVSKCNTKRGGKDSFIW